MFFLCIKPLSMKLKQITAFLEEWAPPAWQEDYDNSGLLVGHPELEVEKVLVCLDATEDTVAEAIERGCQLLLAHHPLIFKGLKRLSGANYVERTLIQAVKHDLAIYALHTNLDNVSTGVNRIIGHKLGIAQAQILQPKKGLLQKLVVFVPLASADALRNALFEAGAGSIGAYDECSFALEGLGSFRGGDASNPRVGEKGQRHYEPEARLEFLVENHRSQSIVAAMKRAHPYEEVAFDLIPLANGHAEVGSGMYGLLPEARPIEVFLDELKEVFGGVIRHSTLCHQEVQKVAWCGGAGSFLLPAAKAVGAELFLSADFKYHQFFDADKEIVIADIGHYESEQFTIALMADALKQKFNNFAVLLTEKNTNPINYR